MSATIQYRVGFGKKDEAVEGPDDADLVLAIDAKDAALDPTVAYMWGKLKAAGNTGVLFGELSSGRAAEVLARLSRRD